MNLPKAACEKYTGRWSWCTQRLVANCHLENSIVWQMPEASLKTGGGERDRVALGSELQCTDSKVNVLVPHMPGIGLPEGTPGRAVFPQGDSNKASGRMDL